MKEKNDIRKTDDLCNCAWICHNLQLDTPVHVLSLVPSQP